MNRWEFQTAEGEIWLWGDEEALQSEKPILLVITGAFASAESPFFNLQPSVEEASVLVGHVPGNLSPTLRHDSISAYAAAYAEVLSGLGRPVIVLGESAGALIALAIRAPNLKGLVLIEPPLVTANLWPLLQIFRPLLEDPKHRAFIGNVFGYGETTVDGRDYRHLVEALKVPTYVFMGSIPLGDPRPVEASPSLIDEPERELLRAHRWIRTVQVQGGGHNLVVGADQKIVDVSRELLARFAV